VHKNPNTEEVTRIKLADFGLSKMTYPGETMNEMCGTPAYVAPEILNKQRYSKKVDVWSAGVIFYMLVCRQLPFSSPDRKTTFDLIKSKQQNMDN
jgi:serine/threonine protein kinase